jgi:hypothetical protein
MNFSKNIIFFIFMVVIVSSSACEKWTSEKKVAPAGKDLPEFSLKDPTGRVFTKKDILKNGVIFVVTAPILSNKKEQEDWTKYLLETKQKGKGRLILLEDMSPSSFKGTALKEMKKESDPGKDPLLLIDPKGELRKALGVEKKDTIVLVYDKEGKRVHEERGKPSQESASRIWKSLK